MVWVVKTHHCYNAQFASACKMLVSPNKKNQIEGDTPERLLEPMLSKFFLLLFLFVLRGSRARPALPLSGAAGCATLRPSTSDPHGVRPCDLPHRTHAPPGPTCPSRPIQTSVKNIMICFSKKCKLSVKSITKQQKTSEAWLRALGKRLRNHILQVFAQRLI